MSRVADSIQPKSGTPSASTNSGTTTTTASDPATAVAVSVVAVSRPAPTACLSLTSRSASPGNGTRPSLTVRTVGSETSAPITVWPLDANWTASGSPILPRATTQIFMLGYFLLPDHCSVRSMVGWFALRRQRHGWSPESAVSSAGDRPGFAPDPARTTRPFRQGGELTGVETVRVRHPGDHPGP